MPAYADMLKHAVHRLPDITTWTRHLGDAIIIHDQINMVLRFAPLRCLLTNAASNLEHARAWKAIVSPAFASEYMVVR
jgi:hypothetical protein